MFMQLLLRFNHKQESISAINTQEHILKSAFGDKPLANWGGFLFFKILKYGGQLLFFGTLDDNIAVLHITFDASPHQLVFDLNGIFANNAESIPWTELSLESGACALRQNPPRSHHHYPIAQTVSLLHIVRRDNYRRMRF
jgi:hypothetical protein